eukprot:Lithocolla_globosa_v1_NODE_3760_length_1589_cov_4.335072.p2 type:complete len:124 gc:universal NODE_3760_length_1589_cov_4.335072:1556-1185(-)
MGTRGSPVSLSYMRNSMTSAAKALGFVQSQFLYTSSSLSSIVMSWRAFSSAKVPISLCDAAFTSLAGTNGGRFRSDIIASQLTVLNHGCAMISSQPFAPSLVFGFLSSNRLQRSAASGSNLSG